MRLPLALLGYIAALNAAQRDASNRLFPIGAQKSSLTMQPSEKTLRR